MIELERRRGGEAVHSVFTANGCLVLVEGMASGCLAIASRLPGVTDVVGDAGVLVPPGDTGALREALGRLVSDPSLVGLLQSRARERSARYSWSTTVDGYEELFSELAARR